MSSEVKASPTARPARQFIHDPRERQRFFRFLIVGAIGAVVDFGVMNLLSQVFHMPLVFAGTVSFIAAVLSNFTWNRFWTYPDSRTKHLAQQLGQFTIISVIGLVIRIPILAILEPPMRKLVAAGWPYLPLGFASLASSTTFSSVVNLWAKNITLAIAVIIVLFWNFFANRFWTYSDV